MQSAWHRTHPDVLRPLLFVRVRLVLTTARLQLRMLDAGDCAFVVQLLNDPAFLEFIGDRGVRTEADARGYIGKLQAAKEKNGYGLYGVTLLETGTVIGLCGLVRRDSLPHADVGFAFLPAYRRSGYGREATLAVLGEADALGLEPLLAICSPLNAGSRGLLEQVGFRFERMTKLGDQPDETCLYVRD